MNLSLLSWEDFLKFLVSDIRIKEEENNISSYKSRFRITREYFLDKDFNRANFREFLTWLKIPEEGKAPRSGSTCNKFQTIGEHINDYLAEFFDIHQNINFKRQHEFKPDIDVLTADEIEQICSVNIPYGRNSDFLNQRNKTMYLLMGVNGGSRIGNLLSLTWNDVKDAPIHHIIYRDTKTRSKEELPLSKTVWVELQKIPRRNTFVFSPFRGDKPLSIPEINNDLKRRAGMCGITKAVTTKVFRHTEASFLGNRTDISQGAAAKAMGYENPNVYLQRYVHSNMQQKLDVLLKHPLLLHERTSETETLEAITTVKNIVAPQRLFIEDTEEETIIRIKKQKGGENHAQTL